MRDAASALRQSAGGGLAIALLLAAAPAHADESAAARRAAAARERDRPYTMVELATGFISLPTADLCSKPAVCKKGDASVGAGIDNLYHVHNIAFGAGIFWATTLRSEATPTTDKVDAQLDRRHARRYFLVEGQFRYYGIRTNAWEWWGGVTVGGVVVDDSWSVKADREPYSDTAFVGPTAATIRTEGLATGLGVGGEWMFASNWNFGTQLRYSIWLLPSNPEQSPTGDLASLSGRIGMFYLGLHIAYRVAL